MASFNVSWLAVVVLVQLVATDVGAVAATRARDGSAAGIVDEALLRSSANRCDPPELRAAVGRICPALTAPSPPRQEDANKSVLPVRDQHSCVEWTA